MLTSSFLIEKWKKEGRYDGKGGHWLSKKHHVTISSNG
jgi:hypothetical protein